MLVKQHTNKPSISSTYGPRTGTPSSNPAIWSRAIVQLRTGIFKAAHPALAGLAGTESNEQVMSGEERHGVCFSAAQTISPGSEELEHPMIRDLSYGIRT